MRIAVVALLLCSACGSNPTDFRLTDGSRLKGMWWQTSDGARVAPAASGWFDAQLSIPCDVGSADDGRPRCVPATLLGSDHDTIEYTDAACTQAAVFGGSPRSDIVCNSAYSPMTTQWASVDAPACGGTTWGRIGDALQSPTPVYSNASGSCVQTGTSQLTPDYQYRVTTVPASTFVGFAAPSPRGSGRLQPRFEVAEDGARMAADIWDTTLATRCEPKTTSDGKLRCVPPTIQTGYLDDQCTQPVAVDSLPGGGCGPAPTEPTLAARGLPVAACAAQQYAIYALADEVTPPTTLYFGTPGACQAIPAKGLRARNLGAEQPPQTFAALDDVVIHHGRIVEHALAADGQIVARGVGLLHDTKLDRDVFPMWLSPTASALLTQPTGDFFADAACTSAVAAASDACSPAPLAIFRPDMDANGCQLTRAFTPVSVGTVELYQGSAAGCSDTGRKAEAFTPGAELPADYFAAIKIVHD